MDEPKPSGETALARPMIASDLDRAGKGQLVYVGRDGEVKNPAAVRNRQVVAYLAFGGITAAGVALAATSFPVLIPFYLALGGRFMGTVRAVRRGNQASGALSNGDAATCRDRRRARRPRRAGARAGAACAGAAVAPAHPAPVLVLHGDQPARRARQA